MFFLAESILGTPCSPKKLEKSAEKVSRES
jgi:hypothetical protein